MAEYSYRTSAGDVKRFLKELRKILDSGNYSLEILPYKACEGPNDEYCTLKTMDYLDYDDEDVIEELIKLTEKDYMESMADSMNKLCNPFHVFGRVIQNKEIYIKVKIRDIVNGEVFCISFHFAKYPLKEFPYK